MKNTPEIIITAGGTQEQIDDVRYVGNFSSGRLGHALAERYSMDGHRVTLLAPRSVKERHGQIDDVTYEHFTSASDLQRLILGYKSANLVLHSAAVSDYTPVRQTGKIPSSKDELLITLQRTPKILPLLRKNFGNETTIVGFKLLSSVATKELIEVATDQITTNRTDYSIANRLEDLNPSTGNRTVHLVNPLGDSIEVDGSTSEVADRLYKEITWRK